MSVNLILGDCLEKMRDLDPCSVDAIVTDPLPPYGIRFMGAAWDGAEIEATAASIREAEQSRLQEGRRARRSDSGRPFGESSYAGSAAAAGQYDLSLSANQAFHAWTEAWAREALRVLKPGGHLLCFASTRTYHRMASGVEDAGFEVRDTIAWMFGSGFPKSHDVARAIDKAQGAEGTWRKEDHFTGRGGARKPSETGGARVGQANHASEDNPEGERHLYEPATEAAAAWDGWGTALKPAFEPIVVARKPLAGTVAANVLEHGTGALNIDASRVGYATEADRRGETRGVHASATAYDGLAGGAFGGLPVGRPIAPAHDGGRWPANVALGHHPDCALVGTREVASDGHYPAARPAGSEVLAGHAGQDGLEERRTRGETVEDWDCHPACAVRLLDQQTGGLHLAGNLGGTPRDLRSYSAGERGETNRVGLMPVSPPDASAGASRFFYCAKVSRAERNAGLEGFEPGPLNWSSGDANPGSFQSGGTDRTARNRHPTVKPVALMRWLIRLVTPEGGTVLDPFLGSGSTGCAAAVDGYAFVGIEREPEYMRTAEARIRFWAEHGVRALEVVRVRERADADRAAAAEAGQLDLLAELAG